MNLASKCILVASVLIICSCATQPPTNLADHQIIPHPVEITATGGSFRVDERVIISTTSESLKSLATYLSKAIDLPITEQVQDHAIVLLSLKKGESHPDDEAYRLEIIEDKIEIIATDPHGIFNGIQTLLQLMPKNNMKPASIPTGKIVDYPRYEYRGSMLDVSRHFFEVEEVKRYIDFLAAYKMNVLHLHLTDDQGWRIEIKSRPKLTEIGSAAEVGDGQGGFYTQQQYQEIVAYAADRFITIIPEIDMPGHTQAALASYPELNCDGKARELYRGTEVGFSTLCTSSEATYEFVDTVIGEIAAITPGNYIHIGGDESHVTKPEDYNYFVGRVQQIVSKYGKTLIGWDEIAQGDIDSGSIVQQWNSAGNAELAAQKGLQVILSPATRTYLDMKYDSTTRLGLAWASLIEVDHGYKWDPDTMSNLAKETILGIEAPLWTETVETMNDIEFMVFPRLAGYAEIGWSPQQVRSWDGYRKRLAAHASKFGREGINFYRSPLVDWVVKNGPAARKD